jgi:predicted RNase H-like HicB family nuclease
MLLCNFPSFASSFLIIFATCLDSRIQERFLRVFIGFITCRERRRTAAAWFRAVGIGREFQLAYYVLGSVGRRVGSLGARAITQIESVVNIENESRIVLAIDDTLTKRFGPCVEGAGIHRNPTPGPAHQEFAYGHIWVTLVRVVRHSFWGAIALPIRAGLYVRQCDIPTIPKHLKWSFRTKLELAVELLEWARPWLEIAKKPIWIVADGAYANQVVLRAAARLSMTVVSRLRHDAALRSLPEERRPGQRGRRRIFGEQRLSLAKRAGARGGWTTEEFELYGRLESVTYKTFLATWRPAGGTIRVVLVKNDDGGWRAYFCTDPTASVADILGLVSDRATIEQVFHDIKEVWGAGQQQLRHIHANSGAYHLHLWGYTLVELWAWNKPEEELVDRSASPWDKEWRRPSHADRRKALLRETLRAEIRASLVGENSREKLAELCERLVALAA